MLACASLQTSRSEDTSKKRNQVWKQTQKGRRHKNSHHFKSCDCRRSTRQPAARLLQRTSSSSKYGWVSFLLLPLLLSVARFIALNLHGLKKAREVELWSILFCLCRRKEFPQNRVCVNMPQALSFHPMKFDRTPQMKSRLPIIREPFLLDNFFFRFSFFFFFFPSSLVCATVKVRNWHRTKKFCFLDRSSCCFCLKRVG